MSAPTFTSLARRLEDSALAFLGTNDFLRTFALRERSDDTPIAAAPVPPDTPPKPVIIISAEDEGRHIKGAPIRNMRLSFMVRANSKIPGGNAASFERIGGTMENFLDASNLVIGLSNDQVKVMLAVRVPGIRYREVNLMREGTLSLDVKAVAAELTTTG